MGETESISYLSFPTQAEIFFVSACLVWFFVDIGPVWGLLTVVVFEVLAGVFRTILGVAASVHRRREIEESVAAEVGD